MRDVLLEVPEAMLAERRRLGLDGRDEVWNAILHMVPRAGGASDYDLTEDEVLAAIRDQLPTELTVLPDVEVLVTAGEPPTVRVPDIVITREARAAANPSRLEAADVLVAVEMRASSSWSGRRHRQVGDVRVLGDDRSRYLGEQKTLPCYSPWPSAADAACWSLWALRWTRSGSGGGPDPVRRLSEPSGVEPQRALCFGVTPSGRAHPISPTDVIQLVPPYKGRQTSGTGSERKPGQPADV